MGACVVGQRTALAGVVMMEDTRRQCARGMRIGLTRGSARGTKIDASRRSTV